MNILINKAGRTVETGSITETVFHKIVVQCYTSFLDRLKFSHLCQDGTTEYTKSCNQDPEWIFNYSPSSAYPVICNHFTEIEISMRIQFDQVMTYWKSITTNKKVWECNVCSFECLWLRYTNQFICDQISNVAVGKYPPSLCLPASPISTIVNL